MKKHSLKALKLVIIIAIIGAIGAVSAYLILNRPQTEPLSPIDTDRSVLMTDAEPTVVPYWFSATTGRLYYGEQPAYNPVGVMIDNSSAARPQWGLQLADIVYEASVEGAYTRFFALYNDIMPDFVGNVRSCRQYFLKMQQEWDALLIHCGGPGSWSSDEVNVYGPIASHLTSARRFDARIGSATAWYAWREYGSDSRLPTPSQWYNVAVNPLAVHDSVTKSTADPRAPLSFSDTPAYASSDYKTIKSFYFEFFNSSEREYTYSAETGLLTRYNTGKPHYAGETGEPLQVQNLIVMIVPYSRPAGDNIHRIIDLTGSGKCYYVIGGKLIVGTWSRPAYTDDTIYYDDKGNEIILTRGNTWVELFPSSKTGTIKITYEN